MTCESPMKAIRIVSAGLGPMWSWSKRPGWAARFSPTTPFLEALAVAASLGLAFQKATGSGM